MKKKQSETENVLPYVLWTTIFGILCMCATIGSIRGCSHSERYYEALSCNRDGCVSLTTFKDYSDCLYFMENIHSLHKERKDKPTRALGCVERNK
jgi:hypothetical protein